MAKKPAQKKGTAGRGGARAGSGRKKTKEPRVPLNARIKAVNREWVDRQRGETLLGIFLDSLIEWVAKAGGQKYPMERETSPADPLPVPIPKKPSAPPDEYDEYRQMRGLYSADQMSKSARGKELVALYEARYQNNDLRGL